MIPGIRTLYAKLVAALLALIALIGAFYVALIVMTTRLHLEAIGQSLQRSLAADLVRDDWLTPDGTLAADALKPVFDRLMVVNPSIELYLLDPSGRILEHAAAPGKVVRERVALEPIATFLAAVEPLPIRGDDPRSLAGRKVFSAAPLHRDGQLHGYLYAILGGEAYDSVAGMLETSYVLRLSLGIMAGGLVLALLVGVLAFRALTHRLRRLAGAMDAFRQSDFCAPVPTPSWRRGTAADEIDQVGVTFEAMMGRIIEQMRALEFADAARRELVASVSHDLRTPLASLQGYLETLIMKNETLSPEEQRQYLDRAWQFCQRLGHLINDLFELAVLESENPRLDVETFSILELAQDIVQKFGLEAETKGVRLDLDLPEDSALIAADIGLIERALTNLLENALKYTPEGGRVRIALRHAQGQVVVRVEDTGPGIPEADLGRVFERFYRSAQPDRTDDPRPADARGTGLGLAITRRIIELHGGQIEATSRLGAGTAFLFRLPLARS